MASRVAEDEYGQVPQPYHITVCKPDDYRKMGKGQERQGKACINESETHQE